MNEQKPDIRYAHPSHAEFNARLEAVHAPTPTDVLAPWTPPYRLPNIKRDFDLLDTYRQTPPHVKEQDNQEQGKSQMVEEDRLAPTYVPPPHIRDAVHRESFGQRWMLEHRNAVLAQAVIPQRGQQRDHMFQQSNHHSGEPPMSTNQQNQHNPNAPLHTFKDGAAVIKLWQQEGRDGQIHVNASVGRLYKDKETGHWKESKSFSPLDLAKLNTLMPQALAHASMLEQNLNTQRQQQIRAHAESQYQSPAPAQHVPVQQPLSQQDMVTQRDAVMEQAQPAQSQSQTHTQEHAHTQTHEPSQ